jgi:uncharacterized protein YjiS (DUF1127 family)
MSAPIAKSQFAFELPKLSYVDASLDDPILRPIQQEQPHGLQHLLAGCVEAVRNWREQHAAMAELSMMSDRELADIGVNRSDLGRLFTAEFRNELATQRHA